MQPWQPPSSLTVEQQAVIQHAHGHARVSAVAGSGKTTTLVQRVLYLLQQGVSPKRLLVVMYNRAARDDFQHKLERLVRATIGPASTLPPLPDVRTFHSLGHRLSTTLVRWGYLSSRKLLMEEWQHDRLTRQALTQLAQSEGSRVDEWLEDDALEAFKAFCTRVKSCLDDPAEVYEHLVLREAQPHFVAGFKALETLLDEQQVMFFDDLIWRPMQVVQQHPELLVRLQGYLDQIIVDEYQDINAVQQALLKTLAGQASLMVVGDVDQCIYEWRGARPDYMLTRFTEDFPGPHQDYPLSTTFRFGHALALAANACIRHNRQRPDQLTLAQPEQRTDLLVGQGCDWLLQQAVDWQGRFPQGRQAILVRSWAQSLPLQLSLLQQGRPFDLGRQEHFVFNRPQIRGLLAYAALALMDRLALANPSLSASYAEALNQVLSFPTLYLTEADRQQLARAYQAGDVDSLLAQWPPAKRRQCRQRLTLLDDLPRWQSLTPGDFVRQVLSSTKALDRVVKAAPTRDAGDEARRLLLGLQRHAEVSQETSLGAWLAQLHEAQAKGAAGGHEGISILTVHSAKGLEWDWLGVYGLDEGDFPYIQKGGRLDAHQIEAERRLFYVAMTRAKTQLVLARTEAIQEPAQPSAGSASRSASPSRFLAEACIDDAQTMGCWWATQSMTEAESTDPEQSITVKDAFTVKAPEVIERYAQALALSLPALTQAAASPDQTTPLAPGDRIRHHVFGEGEVVACEGQGERRILDVAFESAGLRRLMEGMVRLERLAPA